MNAIRKIIEGKELIYEDENDIVRFSMADGQMQSTVTYKKDWYNNSMQPVKKGEMIQETGTDAILKLISAGENLEHFKLIEKRKKITPEDIGKVIIDEKQSAENVKPNTYPTGKIDGSETSRDGN